MFSVETGQMSAVERGQMSAAETGQMSSVARADICLVLTHNVDVSEVSTVQVSDKRSAPKSTKIARNGSRMVGPEASPGHFLASGTGPAAQNPRKVHALRWRGGAIWQTLT